MNNKKRFLLGLITSLSLANFFQVKPVKLEPILGLANKTYSRVFIIGVGIYLIYNKFNSKSKPSAGTYVYKNK